MAQRIPMAPPPDDGPFATRTPSPTHAGERAADQATALYVEQERSSRRARFAALLKRAAAHD